MSAIPSAEFSEIDINHETIGFIAGRLTAELHGARNASNTRKASVQAQLSVAKRVFLNSTDDLIHVGPVIAGCTTGLRVRVTLDPMGYRRTADAAKNGMLGGTSGV